jgi:hypothetical protein
MGEAKRIKTHIQVIKQFRLNGRPCGAPQKIMVHGGNSENFPDELMSIMQGSTPRLDVAVIVPCRIKGDNQIEISPAVASAGMRSFVIDHEREPPILETSAADRRHLKIPDTVVALVGQQIPNTENLAIPLGPAEMKQAEEVGTARWAANASRVLSPRK